MSLPAVRRAAVAPRTPRVRRPPVRPGGDPRRLLHAMRRWLVRRVIGLGLVLVVLCVLQVWLGLQVVNTGYELSEARLMVKRLRHERQELRLELATLRQPERLAESARRRLGMVEPRSGQIVELR